MIAVGEGPIGAQESDATLVRAAQHGSAAAFDLLLLRYHDPVRRYLLRQIGDPEAADLLQETFLDAYRSLGALADDRPFAAWLYQIARNNLRSEWRARKLRRIVSLDWLRERVADTPPGLRQPEAARGAAAPPSLGVHRPGDRANSQPVARSRRTAAQSCQRTVQAAPRDASGGLMRLACGIRSEELILYIDGVLRGGKGELVEAHLRACPLCRQWMADFEQTGYVISEATPPRDDAAGRAAIRARIAREPVPRGRGYYSRQPLFIVVALALLLLAALNLPARSAEARMGIGRFFRFVESEAQRSVLVGGVTPSVAPSPALSPLSPGELATLPFTPQIPTTLPLGLRLMEGQIVHSTRLGLRYRDDRGLTLTLIQERTADVRYTPTMSDARIILIAGVEVLWQPDPAPESVAVLTWEDRGVLPMRTPTGCGPLTTPGKSWKRCLPDGKQRHCGELFARRLSANGTSVASSSCTWFDVRGRYRFGKKLRECEPV